MLSVWICDDEKKARDTFRDRHRTDEGIVITKEIIDADDVPQSLRAAARLPDLVVLDLYCTNAAPGSPDAERVNGEVSKQVASVDKELDKLKEIVDRGKTPKAISVLREIRQDKKLRDLPVLINTRQGLSILDPALLQDAIDLHADWMLKGKGAAIERRYMSACVARHKHKRQPGRDVVLMVLGATLGWLLCALF